MMLFAKFQGALSGFIFKDAGEVEVGFKSQADGNFFKTLIGRHQQVHGLLYPK